VISIARLRNGPAKDCKASFCILHFQFCISLCEPLLNLCDTENVNELVFPFKNRNTIISITFGSYSSIQRACTTDTLTNFLLTMKNQLFVLSFLLLTFSSIAQSENTLPEKKWRWGFSFGSNYSQLIPKGEVPETIRVKNDMGFRMGISCDYLVSQYFSVSPKADLSFNSGRYQFTGNNEFTTDYAILPTALEFMTHFTFRDPGEKRSPYFYFGPNYRLGIEDKSKASTTYSNKSHLALDFGLGFERLLKNFIIAPEIRYSLALEDAQMAPSLPATKFHNISLILHFKG
jgi:hypothetical protein